jgi:hypothetical protein
MEDDFDNGMGLPEDELTGSTSMSDPGDLGLGGMDDDLDSEAPGRPSGGARARSSSASRQGKRPAAARKSAGKAASSASSGMKSARSGMKSASSGMKKAASRGAKKKTAKKSARSASRAPMRKAAKKAAAPGRKRKAGRKK